MWDEAYKGDNTYGRDTLPMDGTDLTKTECTRNDYFDALVGGGNGIGPNVPGVNCNPLEQGMMYNTDRPYGRAENNGGSGYNHYGASYQQNAVNDAYNQQSSSSTTTNNSTGADYSHYTCGGSAYNNGQPLRRTISVNDSLSPENKIKLFADFINDDDPAVAKKVAKKVDEMMLTASKRFASGELSMNDFTKTLMTAIYINSHKKDKDNGK